MADMRLDPAQRRLHGLPHCRHDDHGQHKGHGEGPAAAAPVQPPGPPGDEPIPEAAGLRKRRHPADAELPLVEKAPRFFGTGGFAMGYGITCCAFHGEPKSSSQNGGGHQDQGRHGNIEGVAGGRGHGLLVAAVLALAAVGAVVVAGGRDGGTGGHGLAAALAHGIAGVACLGAGSSLGVLYPVSWPRAGMAEPVARVSPQRLHTVSPV